MIVTPNKKLKLLHAVRRYGPASGIKFHAYEVARKLAAIGDYVKVMLQRNKNCFNTPRGNIQPD